MNSFGPIRKSLARYFVFIGILMSGCASFRDVTVSSQKIVSPGIYEMALPDGSWIHSTTKAPSRGRQSETIRDASFARCPGPDLIVVSRAMINPPESSVVSGSSETPAQNYIEDWYASMSVPSPHQITSTKKVLVHDKYSAIEIICESTEVVESCDTFLNNRPEKIRKGEALTFITRFILIENASESAFPMPWSKKSPKFIVLSISSPASRFDYSNKDFQKILDSFHFIRGNQN